MGFFGVIAYLLQMYIRPQDWTASMYGFPIVDIIASVALIFAIFSLMQEKRPIALPQINFVLLFLLMVFLSNILNGYTDNAFEQLIIYAKRIAAFFIVLCIVKTEKQLKIAMALMIILTVFLAFQSIEQSKTGIGLAGQPLRELHGFGGGRAAWVGAWDGPNVLCLLFVFAIALSLGFISRPYGALWRCLNIIFIGIMLGGVYVTNSRGGFLGLLMVGLAFIWIRFIRNKRLALKAFVILMAVGLIMVGLKFGPSRITELNTEESSAHERTWLWENAFNSVRENPFFGIGKGQYLVSSYDCAHSNFAQNMAEMGLPGLFLYIGLLYLSIKGLYMITKRYSTGNERTALTGISEGLLFGMAGFTIITLFLTMELDFLFVLLGFCAATFNIARKERTDMNLKLSFKDLINISCAMLGVIFFIYLIAIKDII